MITAQDLEFHHSPDSDYTWSETYYIPISVPEERIFAHVYVVTRPVLGTMQADIRVHGCLSDSEFELLALDSQNHLPGPERFSDISAPNGLQIKAVNAPRDYRIDYVGRDGTEIHVDYIGIMDPFDIHDPDQNPLAGQTTEEQLARTSMGSGYRGHYDMHAKVTGTIKVRGKEYQVDIVDRMNHSWGERGEMDIPNMNSVWAQFGEDLGFRFHMHFDPSQPTGEDQKFANGYLLREGKVQAITELDMKTVRVGIVPIAIDVIATAEDGSKYTLHGTPLNGGPWRAYSTCVCWIGLIEWRLGDQVGHGSLQENHNITEEITRRGRRWTTQPPLIHG